MHSALLSALHRRRMRAVVAARAGICGVLMALVFGALLPSAYGLSNHPYPWAEGDTDRTFYISFTDPPKNLDPQKAYSVVDGEIVTLIYEPLLSYDYLARPLQLRPILAKEVPVPEPLTDAEGHPSGIRYQFTIHEGVHYATDPCFPNGEGREVTADDFVYAFKRLADPNTNCPVVESFGHVLGFREYREKLTAIPDDQRRATRKEMGSFAFYESLGDIAGVVKTGRYSFDLILEDRYPQMLYWLAMRFVCAIPHEAVDRYDGTLELTAEEGPNDINQRGVGTGPFMVSWPEFQRESRIVLVANPNWWGRQYPERKAPGTVYPDKPASKQDVEDGVWVARRAGTPLPGIDRIEMYKDKEALPQFNKFMQGYYDYNKIPKENFSQVVAGGNRLTPEMEERGVRLLKDVAMDIRYIGFNMQDDVIGSPLKFSDPAKEANREIWLERNRKLRQAMSLALDAKEFLRIFYHGLGVPAQFLIPPGIYGYDPEYQNPYRQTDPQLTLARQLMAEAGYANGIDPATGKPLQLDFIAGKTDTRNKEIYHFFIDGWKRLGIDVVLSATEYNTFQQKMYEGRFQIFYWGWLLDYPDPENFLFLLYGPNSGKYNPHAPNHTWYENPEYDFWFRQMESMTNEEVAAVTWTNQVGEVQNQELARMDIIRKLRLISENDCAWIPFFHSVEYLLAQPWIDSIQPHPITGQWPVYFGVDSELRAAKREEWNQPVRWPLFVIPLVLAIIIVPAVRVVLKERR